MSIRRMMRQTCQVEPYAGEGARGAVYGTPVTVRCRVQESAAFNQDQGSAADRHEVEPSTVVYLPYGTDCPPRSRLTLPSGQTGTAVDVHQHDGRPAIRHLKVKVT